MTDANPVTVTINGTSATVEPGTFTLTITAVDGVYDFTAIATDAAGNSAQDTVLNYTVDTQAPQITITTPTTTPKPKIKIEFIFV